LATLTIVHAPFLFVWHAAHGDIQLQELPQGVQAFHRKPAFVVVQLAWDPGTADVNPAVAAAVKRRTLGASRVFPRSYDPVISASSRTKR
jgi:hypothetical protein